MGPQVITQIERELKTHYLFDHKNIIKLYNHFEDDKNVYLLLEFASGGTLQQLKTNKGGRFDEKTTKTIYQFSEANLSILRMLVKSRIPRSTSTGDVGVYRVDQLW